MDYKKIGAFLKKEREQKGLSYPQVFEITRIQPSILKSIENGEPQISEVFFKSFIKTYIKFLGLNLKEVLQETEVKKNLEKDQSQELEEKKHFKPRLSWAFAMGLFCFLFLIYYELRNGSKDSRASLGEETSLTDVLDKKDSKAPSIENNNKIDPGKDSKGVEFDDAKKDINTKEFKKLPQSLSQEIRETEFQHELMIKSLEPLTLYFKIDKKALFTKKLNSPLWFVIKAKKSLYIRFDEKVNQVEMFYNGVKWNFTSERFFENTWTI